MFRELIVRVGFFEQAIDVVVVAAEQAERILRAAQLVEIGRQRLERASFVHAVERAALFDAAMAPDPKPS